MRSATALILAWLALSSLPFPAAAQTFEGVIQQRILLAPPNVLAALLGDGPVDPERAFQLSSDELASRAGDPATGVMLVDLTVSSKGDKRRIDLATPMPLAMGSDLYVLLDQSAGQLHLVMPSMRMATSMPLQDLTNLANLGLGMPQVGGIVGANPELRELGASTINGIAVRGYELRGDRVHVRGWTAPEFRGALDVPFLQPPAGDPLARIVAEGLPIRVQALMPAEALQGTIPATNGQVYVLMEVRRVERQAVADSQFEVPAGFQSMPGGD